MKFICFTLIVLFSTHTTFATFKSECSDISTTNNHVWSPIYQRYHCYVIKKEFDEHACNHLTGNWRNVLNVTLPKHVELTIEYHNEASENNTCVYRKCFHYGHDLFPLLYPNHNAKSKVQIVDR